MAAWQAFRPMGELTLGSFNLHMGRGTPGRDAPFYDVVAAAKQVDVDVLVLQEAWVPDHGNDGSPFDEPDDIARIAEALDYRVAATFAVARAVCHDQIELIAPEGSVGDGDWVIAILSRLPVEHAEVRRLGPSFPRDPGRRALLVATVDAGGVPFTVAGTHLPLLTEQALRLVPALRAALPAVDAPAAFAGDMNMWGWCVDRLTPKGWRRAVRGRTYPSHRPHSQTDHILVTPSVEVIGSEVVRQQMSDHRPVRAHLRF
jgi:endonuclease/exonuclease/phosphatase family metal-dependent hydrolase